MSLPTGPDNSEQNDFDEFDEDAPIEIPTDLTNDLANFDENDFDDDFDDDFEEEIDGEYLLDESGFGENMGAGNTKAASDSDDEIELEDE